MTAGEPTLRLERRDDGIAVLWMDDPREPVNTLRPELADEFRQVLDVLQEASAAKALIIISAKPDNFIAGANLDMLQSVKSIAEGRELAELSQAVHMRLASLPMPVVAAIHGSCLGGGLELALATDARVASSDQVTRLGLPEVQLGLLPGGGGTQRLARLIGLAPALRLLLTGRQLDAGQALTQGLVDAVVDREQLLDAAMERALTMRGLHRRTGRPLVPPPVASPFNRRGFVHFLLARNPIGRQLFFARVHRQTVDKTRGNYPAPERILEVVRKGLEQGRVNGFAAEARAFGDLVVSPQSRALVRMFFATRALARENGVDDSRIEASDVDAVGVLGAGLMGVGIAYLCAAKAGSSVTIRERDQASLDKGLQRLGELVDGRVQRKRLSREEGEAIVGRVAGTIDVTPLESASLVIEAVFEDRDLKRKLLAEVESLDQDQVIFASNTSSIPISEIAAGSRHPANVIGMHYFSPADRMPLLEVVITEQTAPQVTATCVAYGKRQGKTVIAVRDGAGFYTSRILAPYLNEAAWLLTEGVAVQTIDRALVDFGFPLGPLALLDDIGIDVAYKVSRVLSDAFGLRMQAPEGMQRLVEEGHVGRKSGRGFYVHDGRPRRRVNDAVDELVGLTSEKDTGTIPIAERCVLQMVNEAARCLESGILRSARDGDVGAVFGLGFPPFLGGPFRYADTLGAAKVVDRLSHFAELHGERYQPAEILRGLAERGQNFYGGGPGQ
ncbi:MAG: fatty acid oxidation complex subunit alpha FadJ [Gammaproteobacteria bacterium]|jgi:3-hydroxyacyl-CoA dehydrogenase/enoyl-CoA hydratase/3-hydroxybutyryl-CoA epimerase|nr:fatty acid oxidation complex subunit alpha FadJ [Gammaproteobacteria bacterium]